MTVNNILTKVTTDKRCVSPTFFDLNKSDDLKSFQALITRTPHLLVHNEINSQLCELMQIKNPKQKLSGSQALELAEKHVGNKNFMSYGLWVHYPWLNTIVHLLPKDEFITVRTSRNNYKITPEEQRILSTKKVGVIGLSVGQSIAITMTMERVFGEISIADFDELELTNLNRIRAGVQNLGVPKVALVAREIAEIDPFLKVNCFWDGVTEENIDDFLTSNGKLDLVADECDTIHIKFLARLACKRHQIPVLMDTSDRGMLDIERFDLEPNRSIFHGLVDHLDVEKSKHLKTNEEKVAYTLPIIGLEKASNRIKASMMEIKQSITTWPQLSSDVALGGAISTNLIRRIFIDKHKESGRYYVDTNEIIPNTKPDAPDHFKDVENPFIKPLIKEDLENGAKPFILYKERLKLPETDEQEILRSALHAPSGANCQPWKWLIKEGAYFLFHDRYYSESLNDFNQNGSHLTMGCVTENFVLSAQNLGYGVNVSVLPCGSDKPLKVVFQITRWSDTNSEPVLKNALSDHIFDRFTNRNKSKGTVIPENDLSFIKSSAEEIQGTNLRLATSQAQLNELADLISIGDYLRITHPQGHRELFQKEIRWTEEQNLKTRDGIDIDLMDLSESDKVGLLLAKDEKVISHLAEWDLGQGLGKISSDLIKNSSAVGFITVNGIDPESYFQAGRATERAWIAAGKLDLAFQPMTVLPYFFQRLLKGNGDAFSENQKDLLRHAWLRFNSIFPCKENDGLAFLFRLSEAQTPTKPSLRRHYNDIVFSQK